MSVYILHYYTCINIPCRDNGVATASAADSAAAPAAISSSSSSSGSSSSNSSKSTSGDVHHERPRRPFVTATRLASEEKAAKIPENNPDPEDLISPSGEIRVGHASHGSSSPCLP
ncbi:hypothetical protein E2C01_073510 [Portunus trituberculatus]|uniref:Uncharacterized protein n=1 Tax=Portunus trituberculatus TaxID=210409 RepID=A0A5B7IAR3_PORTR|nr:hypothetical protein [Portunus trituberculatus]